MARSRLACRVIVRTFFSTVLVLVLAVCTDVTPTTPNNVSPPPHVSVQDPENLPARQPGDSLAASSLAQALASAFEDPGLRQQILSDMRDSPFPRHAIHIGSYLAGQRGAALRVAAMSRSGIPSASLLAKAAVRGGLQLAMRRPMDRAEWTGTPDIVVAGSASTIRERLPQHQHLIGYRVLPDIRRMMDRIGCSDT